MKIKTKNILPATAFILLTGALLLLAGCEKEKNKEKKFEHIDVTELFRCHLTCFDTLTLVNDNVTLKSICPDAPDVDFTNHSFLAVVGCWTSGIDSVWDKWEKVDNTRYKLTIFAKPNCTTMPGGWRKYYLTSKISSKENIYLSVEYITRQSK